MRDIKKQYLIVSSVSSLAMLIVAIVCIVNDLVAWWLGLAIWFASETIIDIIIVAVAKRQLKI